MNLRIFPPDELLEADITLPLSKSITNRALIINALTPGAEPLGDMASCDDSQAMIAALSSADTAINIGAAGTTMRFLTAFYASQPGRQVTLDGSERMRHRPIGILVEALRSLGADIAYRGEEGFPPLAINGRQLEGGELTIEANVSSQYISALLMIAPTMAKGLKLRLMGDVASRPYIAMTLGLMKHWGVECQWEGDVITVPSASYRPAAFSVEADWSAASYWYEIEALTSGWVTLRGLQEKSLQGDSALAQIYTKLGVDTSFQPDEGEGVALSANPDQAPRLEVDLAETPDIAQSIIATCAMLGVPFRITGLASLKIKETDRLEAMRRELLKVGVVMTIEEDSIASWDGRRRPIMEMPVFDTYEDHRMAMALAPVSLYVPGVVINNVEVVAKSYPEFWQHLIDAGFKLVDADHPVAVASEEGEEAEA